LKPEQVLHPYLNVPRFLLPEDFTLEKDLVKFDFDNSIVLRRVQQELRRPQMVKMVQRADLLFDLCSAAIFFFHLWLSFYAVYYQLFPTWVFVLLFLCTRTAMGGIGHYHNHR
jgi:hypothetical protein